MPAISEADRERLLRAINNQRRPTVTVLSSLLAAQDELGYIPDEAIDEVATLNETTINEVWGVASFYTNFRFTPPGRHNVEVCWGPTCHLKGASHILKRIMDQLAWSPRERPPTTTSRSNSTRALARAPSPRS